jgi:hypothetical protein
MNGAIAAFAIVKLSPTETHSAHQLEFGDSRYGLVGRLAAGHEYNVWTHGFYNCVNEEAHACTLDWVLWK